MARDAARTIESGSAGGGAIHTRAAWVWIALALLLFAGALAVRGIRPSPLLPPGERGQPSPIAEPMQFLRGGAAHRYEELTPHLSEELRAPWRGASAALFSMRDCPSLSTWCEGRDGQRLEQLLAELRRGGREDALGALVLLFQLARATDWDEGAAPAEHLGGLLADWLSSWADASAEDPLLYEPALASAIFYGRVMAVAWSSPRFGHNEASYAHARELLLGLCGDPAGRRRPFGRELELRAPRVFAAIQSASSEAFFAVLRGESETLFPGLDGACDG